MSHFPERMSDDAIAHFLRTRSADPSLGLMDDIVRAVGETPQERPWLGLPRTLLPRPAIVLIAMALLLATMGAIGLGSLLLRPDLSVTPLPTTPDAWEHVLIETPQGTGSVASIAAGPHGLLAVVQGGDRHGAGDGPTRLAVSPDGRSWTLVPESQHPGLSDTRSFGLPSVVGTDRGFLLGQHSSVWSSEDGSAWQLLTDSSADPDLEMGGPRVAAIAGPGLVAVGGDKAWYSVDGSDWSLAAVPPLPPEILARPDEERYAEMTGIAVAGDTLIAWGIAEVPAADDGDGQFVTPLLWASQDGRTWTDVGDPLMSSVSSVAGGPYGFVAVGQATGEPAGWFSTDGRVWQRLEAGAFDSRWPKGPDGIRINNDPGDIPVELTLSSAAAGADGYVIVGGDGLCGGEELCGSDEAVIWTSADGRAWSRVASDGRFLGGDARTAIGWGSRFVVGGLRDDRPTIWISKER